MSLKPAKITSYLIDVKDVAHYIPSSCSFTVGQSWATKEKRATDSTETVHNVSILLRRGHQPTTIQISFVLSAAMLDGSMFDALAEYESLIGTNVEVIYGGNSYGRCMVESGTFSISTDYAMGITALSVSYNLKESIVYVPSKATANVRFE